MCTHLHHLSGAPPSPQHSPRPSHCRSTQTDSCTNSLHSKKLNHTALFFCACFFRLFFFQVFLCVFEIQSVINIVQNVTKKKCTFDVFRCVFFFVGWFCDFVFVFYTRQARSGLVRPCTGVGFHSPPPFNCSFQTGALFSSLWTKDSERRHIFLPPRVRQHPTLDQPLVISRGPPLKIDLCIFIYVYIKRV